MKAIILFIKREELWTESKALFRLFMFKLFTREKNK